MMFLFYFTFFKDFLKLYPGIWKNEHTSSWDNLVKHDTDTQTNEGHGLVWLSFWLSYCISLWTYGKESTLAWKGCQVPFSPLSFYVWPSRVTRIIGPNHDLLWKNHIPHQTGINRSAACLSNTWNCCSWGNIYIKNTGKEPAFPPYWKQERLPLLKTNSASPQFLSITLDFPPFGPHSSSLWGWYRTQHSVTFWGFALTESIIDPQISPPS